MTYTAATSEPAVDDFEVFVRDSDEDEDTSLLDPPNYVLHYREEVLREGSEKTKLPPYLSETAQPADQDANSTTTKNHYDHEVCSAIPSRRPWSKRVLKALSLALGLVLLSAIVTPFPGLWLSRLPGFHQHHHSQTAFSFTKHEVRPVRGIHPCGGSSRYHQAHDSEEEPPSREFTRHEYLTPITGHFDLYDYLELTSVLGGIDISISPRPGAKPAVLKLVSNVGSVKVRLAEEFLARTQYLTTSDRAPGEEIPLPNGINIDEHHFDKELDETVSRPFNTEIVSDVGVVDVQYLIGNGGATSVTSRVGGLNLDLLAVGAGPSDPVTTLTTITQPGPHNIVIRSLSRLGSKVTNLRATHIGQGVGVIDISYPPSWEGKLSVTVQGVGEVDVRGQGLLIDAVDLTTIEAHKGNGSTAVTLTGQGAGALKFHC